MLTLISVREEPDETIKEYRNSSGCTIITRRPKLSEEERAKRMKELEIACANLMRKKFELEGWG